MIRFYSSKKIAIKRVLSIGILPMLFTGCNLDPQIRHTMIPVSSRYPGARATADPELVDVPWSRFFLEPRLRDLIGLALENNRDLRMATLQVEKSRAQYGVTASASYPEVSAQGSLARNQSDGRISNDWRANLASTSYELDLFGRVRSLNRQALETYFATAEAQRAAKVVLISEVASQYYSIRLAEEQAIVSRKTLESVQNSHALNKARADAGESNQLELRASESQVESARLDVLTYEQQVARGNHALVFLVGSPLPRGLPSARDFASSRLVRPISPGMPSDLIRNRPDILQAEHKLLASNANIGAARAAFFPSITLTGSAGTRSADFANLFTGGAAAWNFAPQIHIPIFDGGRNRATLQAAESERRIEVAAYEKAIQIAFREVADALSDANTQDSRIPIAISLMKIQSARLQLADERFLQGESPYLEVLTAQQELYGAELGLLDTRHQSLDARISLYKSLGGGWK
jgi:multidrug efflux system outer membrane protein